MNTFIYNLPKAELHVHLEGTLEPNLAILLAKKNGVTIPPGILNTVKNTPKYTDLTAFLKAYYALSHVLQTEQDFYVLTHEYLEKAVKQGVLHTEIAFEVQTYLMRNIPFKTIISGMSAAAHDIQKMYPITVHFILTFLRDKPEEEALALLDESLSYKKYITGIGLASLEKGNPPTKFVTLFKKAREYGYRLTAHAGEDTGPEYMWQALELLKVERIDHGIQCLDDPLLVDHLHKKQIPLTVCPLSNIALNIVRSLTHHPIKRMLTAHLNVSLHSDDPAYFHGYIGDTYVKTQEALNLSNHSMIQCAYNSIRSSFLQQDDIERNLTTLYEYIRNGGSYSTE